MTVAFRDRPQTRSFGEPTAGVPTHNPIMVMSDGAWLVLTVAQDADRTGRVYGLREAIFPDEYIQSDWTLPDIVDGARDPALQAALTWLRAQSGCADR